MATSKEKIDNLLSKIEDELLEFVTFIKSMERDCNNLNNGKFNASLQPSSRTTEHNNSVDHSNKMNSSAVIDALYLVKSFLLRVANLLDQFALLSEADKQGVENCDNPDEKQYYFHYVYQIASYLAKTIQKHLGHFSDKFDELASHLLSDEDEKIDPLVENMPVKQDVQSRQKCPACYFPFKSHPTTNLQKVYEHTKIDPYVYDHKSSPEHSTSDTEDEESNYRDTKIVRYKIKIDEMNLFRILTDSPSHLLRIEESLHELSRAMHMRMVKPGIYKEDIKKDFEIIADLTQDLSRTVEILHKIVKLFQAIYSRMHKKMEHAHTEFPSTSNKRIHHATACNRNITQECCSVICAQCCEICKIIHEETQKKRKTDEKWSFMGSKDVKEPLREPFWLQSDINQTEYTRASKHSKPILTKKNKANNILTEDKNIAHMSFRKRATQNHGTQTSLILNESPYSSEDVRNFDEPLEKKTFVDRKLHSPVQSTESPAFDSSHKHLKKSNQYDHAVVPEKATRKISTGVLRPRPVAKRPPSRKKIPPSLVEKEIPIGLISDKTRYLEVKEDTFETTNSEPDEKLTKTKKSDQFDDISDRGQKPIFLRDITEKIDTPGKFGGFCLLPGINNSSSPKIDVLVEKTEEEDETPPRAILFDIEKFSTLLKEKFKTHLEQSTETSDSDEEPTIVLNIVFDSLGEATNFLTGKDVITTDESESDKETDLVKEVLNIVKQAQVTDTEDEPCEVEEELGTKDDIIVTKTYEKKEPRKTDRKPVVHYCCQMCQDMIDPVMCPVKGSHICNEKCLVMKSLKDCCSECMNGRQRGLTIHQCHDHLPEGILEIRHMDDREKICVCYLFWNRKKELTDWRWQKSPFHDPTRVEIEQETNLERDTILKVIFGPEGTMLKESLAETQLQTVCDSEKYPDVQPKLRESESCERGLHPSTLTSLLGKIKSTGNRLKQLKKSGLGEKERKLLTKIGRFFNDIQKVGYGRGPPLVLKLRRKRILYDAYDLLTVPSNIRLSYYKSLRILFIADYDSKTDPSSSNFQDENKVDELFEEFEQGLFDSPEKRLFFRPSEETQCIYLNPNPNTHPQWFTFAGIVLALAILHQKKLDVMFPICLFKCLLDRPVNIEDLREIEPLVYQKLMWMKENDITTSQRRMNFTIKDKIGKEVYENELMVNGSKIAVTEKNKFRYIDLVVKWKLAERCLSQLNDFRRGFASVIDPGFLANFTEKELRTLIRNPPNPDLFIKASRSDEGGTLDRRGTF